LQYLEFIGKLFAFSITETSLLMSPSFSNLLYKMMLGEEITIDDIVEEFEEEATLIRSIESMIA
jgi:hypothetical protein